MIYKFQPFSITKELGKEYNGHCELVPNDDDWILIIDYDCMILTPKTYQVIENAIKKYPDTLVFGALCNRLGLQSQRLEKQPDENDSIMHHMLRAEALADWYADGECVDANQAAGFFLLFRKSYWKENRFQDTLMTPMGNLFDWIFTRQAGKVSGGIKIILGAYLWHTYRLGKDWKDKSHLRS